MTPQINIPSFVPTNAFNEGQSTILFTIRGFEFHLYSLMIMLGILCSILTIVFFWHREKYKIDILLTLILITIPASIVGARGLFIIEGLIYRPDNPFGGAKWYEVWKGGLSIQGGVILAMILDLWYAYTKRHKIDIRQASSIIIPTILIGQFVGRWGNFANHEVYGKIDWTGATDVFLGRGFAQNMFIGDFYSRDLGLQGGAYRYPLFLYEGLVNLFGYLVLVWVINLFGLAKPGVTAGLYLVWYGIVRLSMEFLRQEPFGIYTNIAIGFTIVGSILSIYWQFFGVVKYMRIKEKYYFRYVYADLVKYNVYVDKTTFRQLWKMFLQMLGKETHLIKKSNA